MAKTKTKKSSGLISSEPTATTPVTHKVIKRRPPASISLTGDSGATPSVSQTPTSTPATTADTTTTATSATSASPGQADPLPTSTAPAVPSTAKSQTLKGFKGNYPNGLELQAMPGAMSDLGRFVDYTAMLGNAATPADTVVSLVTTGLAWRAQRDAAEAWDAYVKVEDGLAWRSAMNVLDEVRPLFLFAVSKNPELATVYPWLTQLFQAPKAVAKQANATKAKKAKVAKTNTTTAESNAVAAATAAAAAATAAADKATTATGTPSKSVTVNT